MSIVSSNNIDYSSAICENSSISEIFKFALDHIQDYVWIIDSNFRLTEFNKAFEKNASDTFKIRLEKGASIFDYIPILDCIDQLKSKYTIAISKNEVQDFEDYITHGDVQHYYKIKICPLKNAEGQLQLVTVASDITKLKKTEKEYQNERVAHEKTQSELDRFLYSTSHDLRAPVLSLKGLLNLIKLDEQKIDLLAYLPLIENCVEKLDYFISEIGNYALNVNEQLQKNEIDFRKIVMESIESLQNIPEMKAIQIDINVQSSGTFISDQKRLHVIFNNIILNAVQYRDINKESFLRIRIIHDSRKAWIVFSDNGIGINEQFQSNIFKMFQRATEKSSGPGLGLFISKKMLDLIHGEIKLSSKHGHGTIININLLTLKNL